MTTVRSPLVASILLAVAAQAPAAPLATLHSFSGPDGNQPHAGLILGSDGNFYGTTLLGGTGVNPAGTVFRMTPNGDVTTLYTFSFQVTGDEPFAGVVEGSDGAFYGTTRGSGAYLGNVFRVTSTGVFTDLHGFTGYFGGLDGSHPQASLLQVGNGVFYGVTLDGGTFGSGTVFRVTSNADYMKLHSFEVADMGTAPTAALVDGGDGKLYGTTSSNVFSVATDGTVANVYKFAQGEGAGAASSLVLGNDGKLYGTTSAGGQHSLGTLYRITTSGAYALLHSFANDGTDGYGPQGALIQAGDGSFYGTTVSGGRIGVGTVFRLATDGTVATIYDFAVNGTDGFSPFGGLVEGADGDLYGTTDGGGTSSDGTVFRLSLAAPPPTTSTSTIPVTTTTGSTSVTTTSTVPVTTTTGVTVVTTTSSAPATTAARPTTTTATTPSPTTTTAPCTSAHCTLDALPENPACAGQTIPSSVTAKLQQATALIDLATSSPSSKAKRLHKRAKKLLKKAEATAHRATKGRTPKLSTGCADAVRNAVEGVVTGLGV